MAKRPDASWRIINSAFKLSEAEGWAGVTLDDIASDAKVARDELYAIFPTKTAILSGFTRRIDAQCLSLTEDEGQSGDQIKDQLFELIMNRFDAMTSHKSALSSILKDTAFVNPMASLSALCSARRSMKLTLKNAGVSTGGPLGRVKVKILTAIYICTTRIWLGDESKDLAKTMAALDKSLTCADQLASYFHPSPKPADAG